MPDNPRGSAQRAKGPRVGYVHDWKSNWFSEKHFSDSFVQNVRLRDRITDKIGHPGLGDIAIRTTATAVEVDIHTARPAAVIGKSGASVEALRRDLHELTGRAVKISILEVKHPELDAKIVAQSIAEQLENGVARRSAINRALTSAMESGAHGCKIQLTGHLDAVAKVLTEDFSDGRVPLHSLRADVSYGFAEARTKFGRVGVKCWVNRGEIADPPEPSSERSDLTRVEEALDRARSELEAAQALARTHTPASDIGSVFESEVRGLVGSDTPDLDVVRRAARAAVAEQAWSQRLGTVLDAKDVVELLGVSKQRVSALAKNRRLVAFSDGGRLRFPAVQFAGTSAEQRSWLAKAHSALVDHGRISPWSAASWLITDHPELEDRDPIAFLREGGESARLMQVAERDAARAGR